jgi:channel protein (hemolysin III family)
LVSDVLVEGKYTQTAREELANSVTHGIGVVLAVAALSLLVTFAGLEGDAWRVVSFSIYGATLILLYLASTLFAPCPSSASSNSSITQRSSC